tara:strand:- start:338 stop:745 length:408 start_codon:yes stop_codon:yes gene_type:complete
MFNFFRKKIVADLIEEPSKTEKPEKAIATITYHVDDEGFIWIDCFWSGEKERSHIAFADLLEKISNGELLSDTMEFIESNCDTEEKKIAYEEVVETVLRLQQMRLFNIMNEAGESNDPSDDDPVISPINVVNMGK